jgi:phage shock protein C
MNTAQKLYRARTGKVLGGVCGGLGDYLNIDKVIVRILFILLAIFGGSGVLVYIILWIAIPEQDAAARYKAQMESSDVEGEPGNLDDAAATRKTNSSMVAGIIMVAVGLLFLLNGLLPMYNFWNFWPVILIAAGILLISPELVKPSK